MMFTFFQKKKKALECRFFVIGCNDGTIIYEHMPDDKYPKNPSSYPDGDGLKWHERDACFINLQVGFRP